MSFKALQGPQDPQVIQDTATGFIPMETPQIWWNTSNLVVSSVTLNLSSRDPRVHRVHQDTADCLVLTPTFLI